MNPCVSGVNRYIITDHELKRTVFHYKGENVIDMLGKKALGKVIQAMADKDPHDRSLSDKKEKGKRTIRKDSSSLGVSTKDPSSSSGYCIRGHINLELRVLCDEWVLLDTFLVVLHKSVEAVRGMIKKEPCEI